MNFQDELRLLLAARIPLIHTITYDEDRVFETLLRIRSSEPAWSKLGIYAWDGADHFSLHIKGEPPFDVSKQAPVNAVLNLIEAHPGPAVFVLPDFHLAWSDKVVLRKLRALSRRLPRREHMLALVLVTPTREAPVELRHDMVQLDAPKPDVTANLEILDRAVGRDGVEPRLREPIAVAALGLSATQVERTFRKAFTAACQKANKDGADLKKIKLDNQASDLIRAEKFRIVRESGALEFLTPTENTGSVGGLEVLRDWVSMRGRAFGEEAAAYGLEPPRGLALVGIPGTGKSLCAKVTASIWKMPLLRLDMGAVFESLLGSSERNLREAIEISELIAPCILWVDEIEKSFAGSGGDGGAASRVLSTFLTWMAEKRKPVCVLATANDVNRLPPEFLRKGRFDEVFFLDLPTREERAAILKVHLTKRGYTRAGDRFQLDAVLDRTEGFVGAELEAVVKDAMFPAFIDGKRQLETRDLLKSAGEMVPLARSRAEHIRGLRRLVELGEARNASRGGAGIEVNAERIRSGRLLDVN